MSSSRTTERVLYGILCFFLVAYTPWWAYLPALGIGIALFPLYIEAIVFSAAIDYYYGAHTYAGTPLAYPFAIAASLIVLAAIELKERMRLTL